MSNGNDDHIPTGHDAVDDGVGITLQEMEAMTVVTKGPALGSVGNLAECSLDRPLEARR